MSRLIMVALVMILVIFMVLVPTEQAYLDRMSKDYGGAHYNLELDAKSLATLGKFKYTNSLFCSTFEYRFGNVSVSYFGFLCYIVRNGSEFQENASPPVTV